MLTADHVAIAIYAAARVAREERHYDIYKLTEACREGYYSAFDCPLADDALLVEMLKVAEQLANFAAVIQGKAPKVPVFGAR